MIKAKNSKVIWIIKAMLFLFVLFGFWRDILLINAEDTIEIKQYSISSVVDVEKSETDVFVLGTHDEKYWFYVDVKSDGALILGKHPVEICKLRKTLSENENPYVRVEEKNGNTVSVKLFLPSNAIIEEYNPAVEEMTEYEALDAALSIFSIIVWIIAIILMIIRLTL
ncbi:MAG: hypothetical protein LBM93_12215 [Oscillospiraceae bacterium]|nr:hypothetical protein [Oscillospiraceae bacterium]